MVHGTWLNHYACFHDAYVHNMYPWCIYLWSLILMHVGMMHVCMMHIYIWCLILDLDACVYDSYIYDPSSWCMYIWCMSKMGTNGRTDSWILGVGYHLPHSMALMNVTIQIDKHFCNCNILLLGVKCESVTKVSPFYFLKNWMIGQKKWNYHYSTTRSSSKIFRVGYE